MKYAIGVDNLEMSLETTTGPLLWQFTKFGPKRLKMGPSYLPALR